MAIVLGSPTTVLAQDIVLPLSDAKKIVVELEKNNIYVEQIKLLEKANGQLTNQTNILKEQNQLLQDQVKLKQEQLDLSSKELNNQKKVYEDKLAICEKDKPTLLDKIKIGVGGVGIGVIMTLVAIILI